MCGIAGVCFATTREQLQSVTAMSHSLRHRGPDDDGTWFDFDANIGLAHRRLSIVDLSESGHQPMLSASGRYVIVLNGEIYNHLEIKHALQKNHSVFFRGHSDTEILLAAIDAWGIDKTLEKSVGMFAFALWDKKEHALYLARDRFGEKPLYYSWIDDALVFASELRAFRFFPGFQKKISSNALDLYLRYAFIPEPFSIYENVFKLKPGNYLKIKNKNNIQEKTYWSAKNVAKHALENKSTLSYSEAIDALEKKLLETVALQCQADVPVGAFLSGGIDSSLITALMQKNSSKPIGTFSIGFHDKSFNEAHHAKKVAQHLGTYHTELYVTEKMCQDMLPSFLATYDEPFVDQSQLPTYLLAKLAREKVVVSLSGDAGDELFGGYSRYQHANRYWNRFRVIPDVMRNVLGSGVTTLLKKISVPNRYQDTLRKLVKYGELFANAKRREDIYFAFIRSDSQVWSAQPIAEPPTLFNTQNQWLETDNFSSWMMWLDTVTYLPDDILTKVDRMTMAVGLENRAPFLDHRIFEFAWSLPISYKMHHGQGKRILRDILYRYVPKALVDRPKQGFGIPLSAWMRGPMMKYVEEVLYDTHSLREHWNVDYVRKIWCEIKNTNHTQHDNMIWAIFVFQQWLTNETQQRVTQNDYSTPLPVL